MCTVMLEHEPMIAERHTPRMKTEVLGLDECHRLLRSSTIGRLGVTIDALPAVLPVNFVIDRGAIVFRIAPGSRIDAATADEVVAFEVDGHYEHDGTGSTWSVLIRGVARALDVQPELTEAQIQRLGTWSPEGTSDRCVTIEPTLITGRRVSSEVGIHA
jgi:nitroimidazol reductase NimA-like FMN-containing flavoprotein (pyridoxamine 5'-phosphate oxidase superfamily)